MPLVYCRSCGQKISDRASSCPHCGDPVAQLASSTAAWQPARLLASMDRLPQWLLASVVILLLVLNAGCLAYFVWGSGVSDRQVLTSADGRVAVSLPAGWQEEPPPAPNAIVAAACPPRGLYLLIFAESKQDLKFLGHQYQQLEGYADLLRDLLAKELIESEVSEPTLGEFNGLPAVQSRLAGKADGMPMVILQTVVETPDTFYQIRAFTTAENIDAALAELSSVISSVQVVQPAVL